jgi:EAL domain-containing protein (putative c-di-GMP-specific phosphodiesterase class I)
VSPDRLTLEITEDSLMADPAAGRDVLLRLRALGVALSIDDFGTGYSSLSYLKALPVSELKLDRQFVADLDDARTTAIVRSTVDLAHSLGLRLVAEGIEDAQALDRVVSLGCDGAQGFHLTRPVPATALPGALEGLAVRSLVA